MRNVMKIRFFLAVLILMGYGCSVGAKTYLVSVGISDYPGDTRDLGLPINDAKTIVWLYSKNTDVEYQQLLDSVATKQAIIGAIQTLFSKAVADDIVVFFFSGHGNSGGFCAYDADMSYAEIRKAMAVSKCNNKMIFADACFSGLLRENKGKSTVQSEAKKSNVMLFLSSRSNETSLERSDMKNGLFTNFLQKGLRGNADFNRDRVITAKELFNFVSKRVAREAASSKRDQHPVMWGKFDDSMPVMKW